MAARPCYLAPGTAAYCMRIYINGPDCFVFEPAPERERGAPLLNPSMLAILAPAIEQFRTDKLRQIDSENAAAHIRINA